MCAKITSWCIAGILLPALLQSADAGELGLIESSDMRLLYFEPAESYITPYVVRSFHNSMLHQRRVFDYSPSEPVTILLTDFTDYGNAGAIAVPRNALLVDIAPTPFTFETSDTAERMYSLMNHELVHVVSMDQAAASDRFYRRLFGGKVAAVPENPETIVYNYLTSPRSDSPRWYMEGVAVFMETWMAGGLGRAQGPFDEMVFRSMVRDGAHFYDRLGLVAEGTQVDFQVGANAYLYGTRFVNYLAYARTPDQLVDWIKRNDGSKRSYAAQFEFVYGLSLDEAWNDWIEFEHDFQLKNLDAIRRYPTTARRDLSNVALGSVSKSFFDEDSKQLYMAVRYPGQVAHIASMSIASGSIKKLEDVKGPMLYRVTSLAYDAATKTLFYTPDNTNYRDLVALDVESGKSKRLLKDSRIGDLAFNPADRSLWGVRHLNGIVTLVRIPYPYAEWNQIQSLPYGELYYDLDISADGKLLSASHGEIDGNQSVRIWRTESLLNGDFTAESSFDFGLAVPENFVFTPDGRYLFGSSYYTGVSNIFRFELATGEIEAVSNAETGFFRPIPMKDGTLIVFHYTGQGFVPAIIDPEPVEDVGSISFLGREVLEKHPQLKDWQVPSPAGVDLNQVITHEGTYSPIRSMGFETVYPVILGYKDSVSLGLKANFSDPIRLDTLSAGASYSIDGDLPADERLNVTIDYQHVVVSESPLSGTWHAGASLNHADFYDLFGPTKHSRKGNRFQLGYDKTLIYDQPRRLALEIELNHYTNFDRLPRYQNVLATIDQMTTLEAGLSYSHLRSSLGHVDDEKGFTWSLGMAANLVDGETIPRFVGEFDFGFALPWKHSNIWFRNAAGLAVGDQEDEFANFYFGGFCNNYVDRGEIKRYREYYALPGFDLNQVPGRNFYRGMFEWNLPPLRFDRVGTPGFYLSWARPSLFVTSLVTNVDGSRVRQDAGSAGAQVDFRFTILSRMDMTLSIGYAAGLYGGLPDNSDEFMVSLKIL